MVAKDGRSYIAEINARQTSVVPGLRVASVLAAGGRRVPVITAPPSAVLTRDRVYFENPATFDRRTPGSIRRSCYWASIAGRRA